MNELKPCPFCGSHNVKMFYDERQNYHVECYGCNKTVSFHITNQSSETKAIEIYNRRTQLENKPLSLEELRQMDTMPVYCVGTKNKGLDGCGLVNLSDERIYDSDGEFWEFEDLGKEYVIYKTKPEQEEK